MALTTTTKDRPQIVFFYLETTASKDDPIILEFGAILLCPNTLLELNRYSKLVRPADLTRIHNFSNRSNGITRDVVAAAGTFAEIADDVYELLNGRIWAGHKVLEWDVPLIKKAFNDINRSAPEPKGILDSLKLLRPGFAGRTGSMEMANLARHFHLGEQTHRSLDDCLMNLEVIKFCATLQFMESSLPDILTDNFWVSPEDIDLENKNTSIPPISVTLTPHFNSQKIFLLHRNLPLKLFCENLTICYDIDGKFTDHRGWPRLNFVVYAPDRLCSVLEMCDSLAEKLLAGCGSKSEWQSVVNISARYNEDLPRVRLNLPNVEDDGNPRLATEVYHEDDSGTKRVVISSFDARELNPLLKRGNLVDAYFNLDTYDYKQRAGIRLVAEKLIVRVIDEMCD